MSSSKRKASNILRESNKKAAQDPSTRNIHPQTWYHIHAIENEGFEIIGELLKAQGWYFLVSSRFGALAEGYDIDVVRQFYSNFQMTEDETHFTSKINGKRITFDQEDFTKFIASLDETEGNLTIDNVGMELNYRDSGGCFPDFNPDTDIKALLQPCFKDASHPMASNLKVHNRLLLHIIYNVVLPRKGSLTYIPKLVFALLHYLNNKIKINYAHLIMGHMFAVTQSSVSSLPHATLISFWLNSVHNIKSKTQSHVVRSFLLYDHSTLNHMFFYDENTQMWNLKKALQGSSSVTSAPSMSNNTHTPTYKNPPSIQIPDAPIFSPPSASSLNQSKTPPVTPYTPSAPAYSPFPSTNPTPQNETSPEPQPTQSEILPEPDNTKQPPSQPDNTKQPPKPTESESTSEPDNSQPSPQPTFPQPQHQPSYSLPSIDSFMESVRRKLDDLRTNTPSTTSFKSACDQLFSQVSEAQISTSIYLQRIEEKVDAYESKMKEYGALTHDCMMELLNSQKSMADTQRNMAAMQNKLSENQSAMKQMIIKLTEAYLEANPIDVDSPASSSKKAPRHRGNR